MPYGACLSSRSFLPDQKVLSVLPDSGLFVPPQRVAKMETVQLVFSKTGDMRFISHLDLIRLLYRASRRAGLPIAYTQGFSPRPKMSFERALRLGQASDEEFAAIYLQQPIEPALVQRGLNEQLPHGIQVRRAQIRIG